MIWWMTSKIIVQRSGKIICKGLSPFHHDNAVMKGAQLIMVQRDS